MPHVYRHQGRCSPPGWLNITATGPQSRLKGGNPAYSSETLQLSFHFDRGLSQTQIVAVRDGTRRKSAGSS
jgi:hypothetical protein